MLVSSIVVVASIFISYFLFVYWREKFENQIRELKNENQQLKTQFSCENDKLRSDLQQLEKINFQIKSDFEESTQKLKEEVRQLENENYQLKAQFLGERIQQLKTENEQNENKANDEKNLVERDYDYEVIQLIKQQNSINEQVNKSINELTDEVIELHETLYLHNHIKTPEYWIKKRKSEKRKIVETQFVKGYLMRNPDFK